MAERKVKQWITINGVHVPIFEGESKADAAKRFKEKIGKRNESQPMTQNAKSQVKKEYTYARNAAHNAKPEKQEKANERFEKAKNKYSKSKEAGVIKSAKRTDDRSARSSVYKEQLKDVQEDIKQFESTPERLRSVDYDKKLADLKQKEANLRGYMDRDKPTQQATKTSTDNVTSARNYNDLTDKLSKNGLKMDSADAHTIQNSNSLNGKKVTMYDKDGNEYQGTYNKYNDGGCEIVDIKRTSDWSKKVVDDNEDLKEKQIAENKRQADNANGKGSSELEQYNRWIQEGKQRLEYLKDKPNSGKEMRDLQDDIRKWEDRAAKVKAENKKQAENAGSYNKPERLRRLLEERNKAESEMLDAYKERQIAENKKQAENANTVFGKEMNDKISNYQDKFLKNKTSEQLDEIQRNLEKGSNIVGYTEQDNIALAAIRKEKEKRADIEYLTALYEAQSYRQERGQDTSKVDAKIAEVKDRLLKDKRTGQEGGLSDKEMREKGYVIDTPITDEMVARGEKKRVAREIADENNAREAKIQEIRQRTGLSLEDSERQLDKTRGVKSKADFDNSRELWKVDREYQRHEASGVHDRQALKKGSEYTFEFNGRDGKKTVEGTYEGTELKGGESVSYFKGKDGKRYVLFDEDIKGNVKPKEHYDYMHPEDKAPVTRYEKARQEAQKSSAEEPQTTRWKKAYDKAQAEAKTVNSPKDKKSTERAIREKEAATKFNQIKAKNGSYQINRVSDGHDLSITVEKVSKRDYWGKKVEGSSPSYTVRIHDNNADERLYYTYGKTFKEVKEIIKRHIKG